MNVSHSELTNNNARQGGALMMRFGRLHIFNTTQLTNRADEGGAIHFEGDILHITQSSLMDNRATDGGAIHARLCDVYISATELSNNSAVSDGGAIFFAETKTVNLLNLQLAHNRARTGGAIFSSGSLNITDTNLTSNRADSDGGAIDITGGDTFLINSDLARNSASSGGAINMKSAKVHLSSILLANNYAIIGGAITSSGRSLNMLYTILTNNSAESNGGAIAITSGDAHLQTVMLKKNNARNGGAIITSANQLYLYNCTISDNTALSDGGAIDIREGSGDVQFMNTNLTNNSAKHGGAIFINTGNTGNTVYCCNTNIQNNTANSQGGAIYLTISTVAMKIHGNHSDINRTEGIVIFNNKAKSGGGIYLRESTLNVHTLLKVLHNTAHDGGGIYSTLISNIKFLQGGEGLISNNKADRNGGGIFATASSIQIAFCHLKIEANKAMANGGGLYLEHNTDIIFEACSTRNCTKTKLELSHNKADYGGGIYVDDDTANSDICEAATEIDNPTNLCFIRTHYKREANKSSNYNKTLFSNNIAMESGNDLYGGLLDRCIEHQSSPDILSGLKYFQDTVSTRQRNMSISSRPVQIKFCDHSEETHSLTVSTRRGQTFVVNVQAIDQLGTPIHATIHSTVSSGRLGEEQAVRDIAKGCSKLKYNVLSNASSVLVELYADGPCTNMGISKRTINVTFQPCECPIGFQKSDSPTNCSCDCDSELKQYIGNCNLENGTIELQANVWIGIDDNNTNGTPYIIHDCPFNYCKETPIKISLNEIDKQCANNRSGILCGECLEGLSLVLATSICKECPNTFLFLIIPFSLAGIALVIFLLVFNITIATGSFHGLIFFTNMLATSKEIFLPFITPNFLTVFTSWVNLDVGIETCFFNGMNSQEKVSLQLVFPVYIYLLIFIIIILCKYSSRFSKLLSNRNPVAVLCTLILLSYSKLLRMIIAVLQYAVIQYPDGRNETVWLYDGNVQHYTIVFHFVATAVILIVGGLFTVLLLFGQWFPLCSKLKIMKWTKNTIYTGFMDVYHAPFTPKHRYWMGLLLFALIFQNVIAAMPTDKFTPIISAGCIAHVLIFLKLVLNPVYKNWIMDCLETFFLLTLIFLSYGTSYIGNDGEEQRTLANVCMAVAFILFVVIVYYHFHKFIMKTTKTWLNVAILAYGISNFNIVKPDQDKAQAPPPPHTILATVSMVLALTIVTGTASYHICIYLLKDRTEVCRKITQLVNAFNKIQDVKIAQHNKNKNNKEITEEELFEYNHQRVVNATPYTDGARMEPHPDRYITPPIVRPATKLDQLREPYLDILAPITDDDYKQAPPSPPANNRPQPTYTVIEALL